MKKNQRNRGIIHIVIIIIGILVIMVLLGFFNSVVKNMNREQNVQNVLH